MHKRQGVTEVVKRHIGCSVAPVLVHRPLQHQSVQHPGFEVTDPALQNMMVSSANDRYGIDLQIRQASDRSQRRIYTATEGLIVQQALLFQEYLAGIPPTELHGPYISEANIKC